MLHDVFDPGKAEAPQTAEFVLAVDGEERVLEVDLNAETPRILSAMTAFDAGCAEVHISKSNAIEHTPRPLRLLKEMAAAQDELAEELARRIAERRETMPPLPGDMTAEEATGLRAPRRGGAGGARRAGAGRGDDRRRPAARSWSGPRAGGRPR